jgi:anaerobic selenocysteine-containing dehydrogenase
MLVRMEYMAEPRFFTCSLCEAECGLALQSGEGGDVIIRGDVSDPLSRGHICPKAVALQDIHNDPDRLVMPQKRTPSGWVSIGWDAALNEAADRLAAIRRTYGRDGIAVYLGNPIMHDYASLFFADLLLRSLRTKNRYSAASVDGLPHLLTSYFMFGHQMLLPIPDLDRTKLIMIIGANPAVSNGSVMMAPNIRNRLSEIRRRGGQIVVVDPRRTETAAIADQHYFVRPGSDVFLLLGILHTIFQRNLVDLGRLNRFTDGVQQLRELVGRFAPAKVEAQVGIAAAEIESIAQNFGTVKPAVCYGRAGASTQLYGSLVCWLINVLNVITGNLDRPGGAMFTLPAVDVVSLTRRLDERGHFGRFTSRVRQLPEFCNELPVAALAEEIDTPGPGQIKALITFAGNPVLSSPNGSRLAAALDKLEYYLAIDRYRNETTRQANIILPPNSPLERDHYGLVTNILGIRNRAKYSKPPLRSGTSTLPDWEILLNLMLLMDARGPWPQRAFAAPKKAVLKALGPRRLLDLLLRIGPYGDHFYPFGRGLNLRRLEQNEHGYDLGPLQACLPRRLAPGRRINLAPAELLAEARKLATCDCPAHLPGALALIGRRDVRSSNSWLHNIPRLVKGPERCQLYVHPADAAVRGLSDGKPGILRSARGVVTVTVAITDEIMPGVVSLPHGWGHSMSGVQLSVAQLHPGVSVNCLTDERRLDALSGTAAFSGLPVWLERATS